MAAKKMKIRAVRSTMKSLSRSFLYGGTIVWFVGVKTTKQKECTPTVVAGGAEMKEKERDENSGGKGMVVGGEHHKQTRRQGPEG